MFVLQILFFCSLVLINLSASADEICPPNSTFLADPVHCFFTCKTEGLIYGCELGLVAGCQCKQDLFLNTITRQCEKVTCENLECVGKPNTKFFEPCVSSSSQSCECSSGEHKTDDCLYGCLCKEGFCKDKTRGCIPKNC